MKCIIVLFLRATVYVSEESVEVFYNDVNLFQASYHPFITGEAFTGPYEPFRETPVIVSMVLFQTICCIFSSHEHGM
jgi:hypothetical protein